MPSKLRPIIIAAATVATLSIAGCPLNQILGPGSNLPNLNTGSAQLQRFADQTELLDFFKVQAQRRINQNRFFGFGADLATNDAVFTAESADDAGAVADGGGDDFTSTNLQEADVDEADVFKSDGAYFYIARGRNIQIVDVLDPANPTAGGSIELDNAVRTFYLRGDRLIVIAQQFRDFDWGPEIASTLIYPPYYVGSGLVLYDLDVSDRNNPTVSQRVEMDGNMVSSRLTNDRLILILSIVPDLPSDLPGILAMELDDILPEFVVDGVTSDLVDWSDYYRPGQPDGVYMTAVVSIDADDLTNEISSTAMVGNASTIYSSSAALYLTDAAYDPNDNFRESTTLHKFSYDDNGGANYIATGSVPGRLLNQYSLGEYEGRLNVATHIPPTFDAFIDEPFGIDIAVANTAQEIDDSVSRNAVYTLVENGDMLEVAGAVDNIAPNERLYSARFMGEKAFLVTFRQIDPFFTVDLSDAANPTIRGELKIPGYSDYLHPFGEDFIIGVGRATAETPFGGVVPSTLQLSLFDVSNLDDPTLVEQIQVGGFGSYADVSYNAKAFAFLESNGLLGLPVYLSDDDFDFGFGEPFVIEVEGDEDGDEDEGSGGQSSEGSEGEASEDSEGEAEDVDREFNKFDGVLTYRVTPDGFEEVGRLSNVLGSFGYRNWSRAAFIGEQVYAVTEYGVNTANVNTLDDSNAVRIEMDDN